jgi:hypothetical protein
MLSSSSSPFSHETKQGIGSELIFQSDLIRFDAAMSFQNSTLTHPHVPSPPYNLAVVKRAKPSRFLRFMHAAHNGSPERTEISAILEDQRGKDLWAFHHRYSGT